MTKLLGSGRAGGLRLPARVFLPALATVLAWTLAAPAQAQSWVRFDFQQTQTTLSVAIESSRSISSDYWSYAGPLDDNDKCSPDHFGGLDDSLKGRAAVTKTGDKTARAEIGISPANNNKLYCFILEGSGARRRLDFNPPIIELADESNLLKAQDSYHGIYGPSGNVDSNSWQAAVFDAARAGGDYQCRGDNQQLQFQPVSADAKHIRQYSYGNTNHLGYGVPSYKDSAIEFYNQLKSLIYTADETNTALIPFVDGQWNPVFTDNIHLCHRVSDPQGNTGYQLMRLDFAGPVISLGIDGRSIRASSAAVDLDPSTWQYLSTNQRHGRLSCENSDRLFDEPTGRSAVVDQAVDNLQYCFLVADKQGNVGTAWIQADLDASPPATTEAKPPATEPEPAEDNNQPPAGDSSSQQLAGQDPAPGQSSPGTIDSQAANVNEAAPATDPSGSPAQAEAAEAGSDPELGDDQAVTESGPEPGAAPEPAGDRLGWTIFWSLAGLLAVMAGGWLAIRNKTKARPEPADGSD